MAHRVVVTGVGLHGAFGDLSATLAALERSRSALVPVELPDMSGLPEMVGAPAAPGDELRRLLPDRKLRKFMNPTCELAVLAAGRALADAKLEPQHRDDTALFMATGLIAFDLSQILHLHGDLTDDRGAFDLERMGQRGLRACHPLMPFKMLLNMPLGMVSIVHGLRGENAILYPGLDQGAVALERALRGIRTGRFQRVLVGGSAQQLSLLPLTTMSADGRLATTETTSTPGDNHQGLAPADVGAFVVLESRARARERGVRSLAELTRVRLAWDRELLGCDDETPPAADPEVSPVGHLHLTGSHDAAGDREEQAWQQARPRARCAEVHRYDHRLGFAGAAAIPQCLALACGRSGSHTAWVLGGERDGMQSLIELRFDEEVGR